MLQIKAVTENIPPDVAFVYFHKKQNMYAWEENQ